MSEEPEQIGDLYFVPNPNYPYPFSVERPPHFWMTEQGGQLAEAIEVYFNAESLTPQALSLIKQYLRQYIERAVITGDANRRTLLNKLETLRNSRDIERFADEIAEIGIEPF